MKQYFLKISGLAVLAIALHTSAIAQEDGQDNNGKKNSTYEVIIKHKSDKDAKITVEIKDGKVTVNGKPIEDFHDSTVTVLQRKMFNSRNFTFNGDDGPSLMLDGVPAPPGMHNRAWITEDGGPKHAFLGVSTQRSGDGSGAKILSVTSGSAAEKSGLKEGDVITKIDAAVIADPESLTKAIVHHKPGEKVNITFSRDGKVQNQTATLGENEEAKVFTFSMPKMEEFRQYMPREGYGFLMDDHALKLGIQAQDTEDGKGVKVLSVDDESNAAKAGIKENDIITRFDGQEVNSATTLAELARAAKTKPSVKIGLLRDGKPMEIEVRVPKHLHTADL